MLNADLEMKNLLYCSVIICTHNRAESLKRTLEKVLQQEYDQNQLEILVVDNCSIDDTKQSTASFMHDARYPVRYVYEPELGISHARNCGLNNAQGEIVVFIDDDAIPRNNNWIQRLGSVYTDPQIRAAGGDVELLWPESGRPKWLHDLLLIPLGLTQFHLIEMTELNYPIYPCGGNISFRKETIQKLNGFSTQLGRIGNALLAGEESELCLRLEKAGKKIVYVPGAIVDHLVTREKLTKEWFRKNAWGYGLSAASIEVAHMKKIRVILNFICKTLLGLTLPWGKMLFSLLRMRKWELLFNYKANASWAYILRILGLR